MGSAWRPLLGWARGDWDIIENQPVRDVITVVLVAFTLEIRKRFPLMCSLPALPSRLEKEVRFPRTQWKRWAGTSVSSRVGDGDGRVCAQGLASRGSSGFGQGGQAGASGVGGIYVGLEARIGRALLGSVSRRCEISARGLFGRTSRADTDFGRALEGGGIVVETNLLKVADVGENAAIVATEGLEG